MEYIKGPTLIKYLEEADPDEFEEISEDLIRIIKLMRSSVKQEKVNLAKEFKNKIGSLREVLPETYIGLLDKLEESSKNLPTVKGTFCHGDLTLENIIYDAKNRKYYLIDFQDIFAEHYWFDISVMFQDIAEVWFFLMNENLDAKTMKIKMDLLQNAINPGLRELDKDYFKHHSTFVAMKFFRIIPYAEEKNHNYLAMVIQKHLGTVKKKRKTNLFLIGHPVSGIREAYNLLQQHPDIFMSYPQEPNYFCKDFNKELENFYEKKYTHMKEMRPKDEKEYMSWFVGLKKEKIIGDASTNYLYSKVAAKEIKNYNRDAKIIIFLRDPKSFLREFHEERSLKEEPVDNFDKAVSLERSRKDGRDLHGVLPPVSFTYYSEIVKYSEQIKKYVDNFPKKNIKLIIYEDLVKNPISTSKEIFDFLGVDEKFTPKIINEEKIRRIKRRGLKRALDSPAMLRTRKGFKKIVGGALGGKTLEKMEKAYVSLIYDKKPASNPKEEKNEDSEIEKVKRMIKG